MLKLLPPFSLFHPPLLLPFGDCHVEPKQWYAIGKTVQHTLREVSDIQLIVHSEVRDWIEEQITNLGVSQTDKRINDDASERMTATV